MKKLYRFERRRGETCASERDLELVTVIVVCSVNLREKIGRLERYTHSFAVLSATLYELSLEQSL